MLFLMTASHPAGTDVDGCSRKDLCSPPEGTAPAPPDEKNPLYQTADGCLRYTGVTFGGPLTAYQHNKHPQMFRKLKERLKPGAKKSI